MRFRIRKNEHGSVYTIVVSGEMDDESGWDLLQVAQVMLAMPRCRETLPPNFPCPPELYEGQQEGHSAACWLLAPESK